MNAKEWQDLIAKTIEQKDLYGSSFTDGVALYNIMEDYNGEATEQAVEVAREWFYELTEKLAEVHSDWNAHAWREILDISVLDELARYLMGEEEE